MRREMLHSHDADCTMLTNIASRRDGFNMCSSMSGNRSDCELHRVGRTPCVHNGTRCARRKTPCSTFAMQGEGKATVCLARPAAADATACILDGLQTHRGLRREALEEGARFAVERHEAHNLWLEFGAHNGGSTRNLMHAHAKLTHAKLFSFDSFRGLPEQWRERPSGANKAALRAWEAYYAAGAFDLGGKPPFTDPRVEWVVGWFNESLPRFLRSHPQNVSLVHIDCDLYSSTDTVLRLLQPRLSPGALLIFDELINYPDYAANELKALLELQQRSGRSLRVLGTQALTILRRREDIVRALAARGGTEMPNVAPYQQDAAFALL